MDSSGQNRAEAEVERLRKDLDLESRRRLDVQRQLDRAGVEFEEFVSIAAHNLRDSLRDVASYGQLMAERYAGRLDADAGEFLERIQDGAAKMQSLLTGVVDYWALGAGGRISSRTDMEAVFRQAILSAEKQIADRSATVTHDSLPEVMGEFDIMARVLRHLIGNAIEYCVAPVPRVHVSARREDLEWAFSVQDNGPGIEMTFKDRVFEAFKRLHGNEHPGNGLGLAFCRKAIERHGGRIWVESTPGAGSTFLFTLPSAD